MQESRNQVYDSRSKTPIMQRFKYVRPKYFKLQECNYQKSSMQVF